VNRTELDLIELGERVTKHFRVSDSPLEDIVTYRIDKPTLICSRHLKPTILPATLLPRPSRPSLAPSDNPESCDHGR
jgi:hypothetical protein